MCRSEALDNARPVTRLRRTSSRRITAQAERPVIPATLKDVRRCMLLLVVAAGFVSGCGAGESDVRQLDTYEVSVNDDGTGLTVTAEPCGELRVSTVETDEQVRLTVMLIGGGDCGGSSSPPVSLVRPLASRMIVDDRSGDSVAGS